MKPKQVLVYDYETFYDREYSLSNMSTLDYIMDRRFQPLCLSVKVNNDEPVVIPGDGTTAPKTMRELLMDSGWERALVVAHNNRFDAAISRFRLKLPAPAMYGCTRYMAQAVVRPFVLTVTLKAVADYYGVGVKGDQRETYIGYRLQDFSADQLNDYMRYCCNDTSLAHAILIKMVSGFPSTELENIDLVLRMYLHPVFRLNPQVLTEHLNKIQTDKEALLASLPEGVTKAELSSNPKFAMVLQALGVDAPTKISTRTGNETFAFAKSDEGFKDLLEHLDPMVQVVATARVGVKSTIEETRTQRLLNIANRYGVLSVPLVYAGAHTLRYAGDEKLNLQNPPRGSRIREAIEAPKGYVVTTADYSQIEARIAAALAGCNSLLAAFADPDRDPYAEAASATFGRKIIKKDNPRERWVGKVQVLQLQYGSGPLKVQQTLARGEGTMPGLKVSEAEAKKIVYSYRDRYHEIPALWRYLDDCIKRMARKESFDMFNGIDVLLGMVRLPNGLFMPYDQLSVTQHNEYTYQYGAERRKLYGAMLLENLCQALTALIIREAMVRLNRRGLRALLQVHDDVSFVHKEDELPHVTQLLKEEMLKVPAWLPNLPLAIEIKSGPNYLNKVLIA